MNIKCPLTDLSDIELERTIKTQFLIDAWKNRELSVDVARFFKGLNEIYVYKCKDTGYRFYYPFNISGDDQFYKDLQRLPWYYMDWKWEYQKIYELIKSGERVLEIGCGDGSFIKKLKDKNVSVVGLEFSAEAIKKCQEKGLTVFKENIQEYAKNNKEKYNIVCSFQVMEHIADIGNAIQASIDVIKNGGKLIISIPNSDSFTGKDINNLLDMPPHHMAIWNEQSLRGLEKIFNIKLDKIYFEPLQSYHFRFYYHVLFGSKISKFFGKFLGDIINKILGRISLFLLVHTKLPEKIKGHTIMAVYIKI